MSACQKPAEKDLDPSYIAKVQGRVIRERDVLEEFRRQSESAAPGDKGRTLRDCLERLIETESLYVRAVAAGYDQRPDLQAQFKRLIISKFEQDEAQKRAGEEAVSADAVRAYYEAHLKDYTSPEKVRVSVLYVKLSPKAEPEQAMKAQARAEALRSKALEEVSGLEDFGPLAQEHSDDQSTRYRGGDCGYITRSSGNIAWEAAVRDAAFSLNRVGEISPVIKARDGFYLLKLAERKPPEVAPLPAVSGRIQRELSDQLRRTTQARFYADMRKGLEIKVNEEALRAIPVPSSPAPQNSSEPPRGPTP